MVGKAQEQIIITRIIETVNSFYKFDGKISDEDLACYLNNKGITTSSSTVGRDLVNYRVNSLFSKDTLEDIKRRRRENKINGNAQGLINSHSNNIYSKGKDGKFNGMTRK